MDLFNINIMFPELDALFMKSIWIESYSRKIITNISYKSKSNKFNHNIYIMILYK